MAEQKMGFWGATSLTVVSLIGTGLFFGPALSALYVGTAAIWAWLILGLICIYIGFVFGELVSMFPSAGGVYEFTKRAYGRMFSFWIGWMMWLLATMTTSILIVAALEYVFPMLSFTAQLTLSIVLLVVLHLIALGGVGTSSVILDIFAGILIVFVVVTIAVGIFQIDISNFSGLMEATPSPDLPLAFAPEYALPILLFLALFFILETFFGWETACFLAEETKNPRKTIPKALVFSVILAAFLGWALVAVIFGMIPARELASSATPLIDIFRELFGPYGEGLLKAGVFLSLIGSAAGNIISGPRLLMAMARDKLFVEQLSEQIGGVPRRAILFQGLVSLIVLMFALGGYKTLLELLVPLALLMYVPTLLALPILKKKFPSKSTFKCPFPRIGTFLVSLLFVLSFVMWISFEPGAVNVFRFMMSLVLFGLPIYLLLSVYYNPSTQLFFSDALAWPAYYLEDFVMPTNVRRKILTTYGNLAAKNVLEFGAGIGTLTMELSKAVGPVGKVFAVESGKTSHRMLQDRAKTHQNIVPIFDEHATSRLHPEIQNVDAIFSTGMLGYLQDWRKVLDDLSAVLPDHGHVCFMEWVDYFGFLPNPSWLSNQERLLQDFRDAGFSVRIEKVRGLFWNYLLVHGVKSSEPIPYV